MPRRFYYDCEFVETGGSAHPTIDLISVGVVAEDGREFYAVSSEFDQAAAEANLFVRDLVLPQLPGPGERLPRAEIRDRLLAFLAPSADDKVELWGWYADYDHVALCWLFGRMVDLPPGMPMWTRDLKQVAAALGDPPLPKPPEGAHHALNDARWVREAHGVFRRAMERQAGECHVCGSVPGRYTDRWGICSRCGVPPPIKALFGSIQADRDQLLRAACPNREWPFILVTDALAEIAGLRRRAGEGP